MTEEQLHSIIRAGESSTVEFKTDDIHPMALAEEVAAFANFEGGTVFIGIADDGSIRGCSREGLEEFVVNVCRNNVRPSIIPHIERVVAGSSKVLVVTVPRGETAHATSRGHYFIRVGSTKQLPTQQELIRLFQQRKLLQFDETPVLQAGPGAVDVSLVNEYLSHLGQQPVDDSSESALRNELVNMSICIEVDGGVYPTLGGLLMFGRDPQRYFPSFLIQCGAYRGEDVTSEAVSEKESRGTITRQIEDAMAFFRLVLPQDHALEDSTRRRDSFAYPLQALREALVNAACHRDYTITGSSIRVFVFDDRIEIRSPGGLPNTLTLQSMQYRQFTRNQIIASFLAGLGYMERRGKGILRIKKLSEEFGCSCSFDLGPDETEFTVIIRQGEAQK